MTCESIQQKGRSVSILVIIQEERTQIYAAAAAADRATLRAYEQIGVDRGADPPPRRVLAGERRGLAEEEPRGEVGDGAGEAEEQREAGDPGHEEEADGEREGAAEHERHRRAEEHGRRRGRRHPARQPRRRRGGDDREEQRAELADQPRVVLVAAAGPRHGSRWVPCGWAERRNC